MSENIKNKNDLITSNKKSLSLKQKYNLLESSSNIEQESSIERSLSNNINLNSSPENNIKMTKSTNLLKKRSASFFTREQFKSYTCKTHLDIPLNFKKLASMLKSSMTIDNKKNNKKVVNGKANYFPPEKLLGKKTEEGIEDFWAIGIMIYNIYTNKLPFDAKKTEDIISNILQNKVDWNKMEIIKDLHKDLLELVKSLLNPSLKDRTKSLKEIKKSKYFKGK